MDKMNRIVLCKACSQPEFYGEMRWKSGYTICRACYRSEYETRTGRTYNWSDLDGPVPSMEEYLLQQAKEDIDE